MSERIAVGLVRRPKGVRGEVKVEVFSPDPRRFDRLERVFLERDGQADRELRLERWRADMPGILVKFAGVDTPEAVVAELQGGYLTVPREEVPPLPADEHYVFEIVGCRVEDGDGNALGRVVEVQTLPSVDVYVVRGGPAELLLPAVADFIVELDIANGRIVARGIEELLP